MNENKKVSIDAVIDRIKICGYIDCNEYDGCYDEYEYDNILYYLEKYKNLQSKIDKAIEYIEKSMNNPQPFYEYIFGDENGKVENLDKLLNILKEE